MQSIADRYNNTVRNYQFSSEFSPTSFYDATHLNMHKGRPKFSMLLAQDIASELAQQDVEADSPAL